MKQNIFEIRQRARELVEEAIAMWQQGSQSDQLEGLEKDPIFSMLISAVAYQNSETENEIARIEEEVVREFVSQLAPYEMGHPLPATIALQTALEAGCPEMELDSGSYAYLVDNTYAFMPLFRTRVINAHIRSIVRLDGRRWKVVLNFESPVTDLSRFCFAIQNSYFEDVRISCNGKLLPLIRPWQSSKLPMTRCFSHDCALYNNSQYFNASMIGMELFSRQNLRMFCIRDHKPEDYLPKEVDNLELIFEFMGISEGFTFDYSQLLLNSVVMVEAQLNYATLSNEHPIVRLAGYDNEENKGRTPQFLHLIRPSEDQLYADVDIQLRRTSADRFNRASLSRLLSSLINKYHSDFYAFQQTEELTRDNVMESLYDILQHLLTASTHEGGIAVGTYAMLNKSDVNSSRKISVDLPYLTTHGASVNSMLSEDMHITMPSRFDNAATRIIAPPIPGSDEITDKDAEESLMRYRIVTNNRVVTPADVKLFCYTELKARYSIDSSMIASIDVAPRRTGFERNSVGYEIMTEIVLKDNNYIKRSFEDKLDYVAQLLERMIEIRTTGIYPIRVHITLEEIQ